MVEGLVGVGFAVSGRHINSGGLLPELVLLGEGLLVLVELRTTLNLRLDLLGHLLDLILGQSFFRLDLRDVAVRVGDLGDGLLVVALRGLCQNDSVSIDAS